VTILFPAGVHQNITKKSTLDMLSWCWLVWVLVQTVPVNIGALFIFFHKNNQLKMWTPSASLCWLAK
jgi:hypothetical protein